MADQFFTVTHKSDPYAFLASVNLESRSTQHCTDLCSLSLQSCKVPGTRSMFPTSFLGLNESRCWLNEWEQTKLLGWGCQGVQCRACCPQLGAVPFFLPFLSHCATPHPPLGQNSHVFPSYLEPYCPLHMCNEHLC